jgi:chromate reductase
VGGSIVLALVGSLRQASYNAALARHIRGLIEPRASWDQPDINALPFYNDDLQNDPGSAGASARDFQDHVRKAAGILIISPEYNWSFPALIKNAIDWGSRPWSEQPIKGKPVFLGGVSNGPVGTARMQLAMRQVFGNTGNAIAHQTGVSVGNAKDKFDAELKLVDAATADHVAKAVEEFLKAIGA